MADIQEARVVGDWRRIVGDYISSHEVEGDDIGVNGTVTLTPTFAKGGPQGVLGTPDAFYSPHTLTCKVLWGQLHDGDLNNPWQDIVVKVDGNPLVWTAAFSLTYKDRPDQPAQKIMLPNITFDVAAVVDGRISLTTLIPAAQVPAGYQAHFVSAQASAVAADAAKVTAVGAASTASTAASTATGAAGTATAKAAAAAESATLAGTEAAKAVGLASAQDSAIAGRVTDATSATHAAFKAVGNATYLLKGEMPTIPDGVITSRTVGNVIAVPEDAPAPTLADGDMLVRYSIPGAVYKADFSAAPLGAGVPAGWSPFGQAGTWSVVAEAGATGGKGLLFTGTNATSRTGLALNAVTTDPTRADVEILYRWKCDWAQLGQPVIARAVADATPTIFDGVGGGVVDSGSLRVHNYASGAYTTSAPFASPTTQGTWYRTRVRVEGNTVSVRQWVDGQAEPLVWQSVAAAARSAPGLVGLLHTRHRPQITDWIVIATGGRKAVKA